MGDLVLSVPVSVVAAVYSPRVAFALFFPLFLALEWALSLWLIGHAGKGHGRGRLERLLTHELDRPKLRGIRQLVVTGTVLGFVASSIVLGGVATTWLLWLLGRRDHIRRDSFVACAVFAAALVATYAGLVSIAL